MALSEPEVRRIVINEFPDEAPEVIDHIVRIVTAESQYDKRFELKASMYRTIQNCMFRQLKPLNQIQQHPRCPVCGFDQLADDSPYGCPRCNMRKDPNNPYGGWIS